MPEPFPPGPGLLTVSQAAEWLNIPAKTLAMYVAAGTIPHTKIGKHVRFTPQHLAETVAAGEHRPVTAAPGPGRTGHRAPQRRARR